MLSKFAYIRRFHVSQAATSSQACSCSRPFSSTFAAPAWTLEKRAHGDHLIERKSHRTLPLAQPQKVNCSLSHARGFQVSSGAVTPSVEGRQGGLAASSVPTLRKQTRGGGKINTTGVVTAKAGAPSPSVEVGGVKAKSKRARKNQRVMVEAGPPVMPEEGQSLPSKQCGAPLAAEVSSSQSVSLGALSPPGKQRVPKRRKKSLRQSTIAAPTVAPLPVEDVISPPSEAIAPAGVTKPSADIQPSISNGDDDAPDRDIEGFMRMLHEEVMLREKRLAEERKRIQKAVPCARAGPLVPEGTMEEGAGYSKAPTAGLETEQLTSEQQHAVDLALCRRNLFITGGAGTGKSLVLREIVLRLRERRANVYVTATTGVAALNVRGATINSFAGVKFGGGTKEELLKYVRRSRKACGRWAYCSTLIIDEVSMMDVDLLDKLNFIAQSIRKKPGVPFGGIQVILCGDFLQLPPIPPHNRGRSPDAVDPSGADNAVKKTYCFQSETWKELQLVPVVLHHHHRQEQDSAFQRILDELRMGYLSDESRLHLQARAVVGSDSSKTVLSAEPSSYAQGSTTLGSGNDVLTEEDKHFVRLCASNKEVDARNAKYFAQLEPITDVSNISRLVEDPRGTPQRGAEASDHDALRPLLTYTAHDVLHDTQGERKGKSIVLPQHGSNALSRGDAFDRRSHASSNGGGQVADPRASWVKFEDSNLATTLPLKVGTRVMLLQNVSTRVGLVNGSVGEVTGFLHPLEMVDLVLRAPRERHHMTPRGTELLRRGGFGTLTDAFRCVDASYAQSLFWWLRHNYPAIRRVDNLSYGDVYGSTHLRDVQHLTGLDEIASSEGEALVSIHDTEENSVRVGEDELPVGTTWIDELAVTTGVRSSNVHAKGLYLGGILPLHLQMMRLPVVRFDVQPVHRRHAGVQPRALPRHVYAFVSPVTQHWYMGNVVIASRTQIPLRHAWAITVHKSQGLTIAQLQVDMGRFFTPGQAYVALSRATSLENIKLLNFHPRSVRACPTAMEFHKKLM